MGASMAWAGGMEGFKAVFNTEGTGFVEVRAGARNGSKDPPLQRRERKTRGRNPSRLPLFLRINGASMGNGSRASYQLSIDLLFTE